MALGRTGNPTLNDSVFDVFAPATARSRADTMTIQGTVNKTGILLLVTFAAAAWTWSLFHRALDPAIGLGVVTPWTIGGAVGGLVLALVTVFKKAWAPVTAPLYCVCEGFLLGGVSALFELQFPGIVIQAIGLTFGTLGALLLAYRSGLIQVTQNFRLGLFAATGAIALLYLGELVANLAFGVRVPYIHESGLIGIGFSLVVVVIAALNLVLDFDFIERGAERGAPKFMEWYGAFGLMVTLIWLYFEMLRLLAKLRSR